MRTTPLMLSILSGLVLQPVFAAPPDRFPEPQYETRRSDGHLTSNEAGRIAQQQQGGGRILSVEHTAEGYRVKLLHKGDVRIVVIPYNN